jgi:hypothetical protein
MNFIVILLIGFYFCSGVNLRRLWRRFMRRLICISKCERVLLGGCDVDVFASQRTAVFHAFHVFGWRSGGHFFDLLADHRAAILIFFGWRRQVELNETVDERRRIRCHNCGRLTRKSEQQQQQQQREGPSRLEMNEDEELRRRRKQRKEMPDKEAGRSEEEMKRVVWGAGVRAIGEPFISRETTGHSRPSASSAPVLSAKATTDCGPTAKLCTPAASIRLLFYFNLVVVAVVVVLFFKFKLISLNFVSGNVANVWQFLEME